MKKLRIGIIGTGAIAGHHIKSVQELENCELVALASSSKERAIEASSKHRVVAYRSYQQLIDNPTIEAVIICTHSGNHLEPALAAAKEGKHILVEKPIEVNSTKAEKMITTCQEAGVQLGVVFQNRFSSGYLKLKQAIDAGKLGKLILGNAYIKWFRSAEYYQKSHWKGTIAGDGGAALINQGIHTIDLLLDSMGDVESVFGKIKTVKHQIEGEDLGVAMLTFKNGALGTIEGSTAIHPGYPERLEIYGEKGSIILEAGNIVSWEIEGEESIALNGHANNSGNSNPMDIGHQLHKAQIHNFVEAILNNERPLVDGPSGTKSLTIIESIYLSAKEQKEIFL